MIRYSMVLRSTQAMSIAEDCVNKLGSLLFSALHQLYDAYIERAQMQLAPLARSAEQRIRSGTHRYSLSVGAGWHICEGKRTTA
jgi:hypothetical protein